MLAINRKLSLVAMLVGIMFGASSFAADPDSSKFGASKLGSSRKNKTASAYKTKNKPEKRYSVDNSDLAVSTTDLGRSVSIGTNGSRFTPELAKAIVSAYMARKNLNVPGVIFSSWSSDGSIMVSVLGKDKAEEFVSVLFDDDIKRECGTKKVIYAHKKLPDHSGFWLTNKNLDDMSQKNLAGDVQTHDQAPALNDDEGTGEESDDAFLKRSFNENGDGVAG